MHQLPLEHEIVLIPTQRTSQNLRFVARFEIIRLRGRDTEQRIEDRDINSDWYVWRIHPSIHFPAHSDEEYLSGTRLRDALLAKLY